MTDSISFADFIVVPVFLILFFFIATFIKQRNIDKNPAYRYYTTGLFVKLLGAIAICLSYIFYFSGGDTIGYHHDCTTISKCFLHSPYQMLRLTFLGIDTQSYMAFDFSTGYPYYAYDLRTYFLIRVIWPLNLLSFYTFIGQTMLLSFICYQAIWRMYLMLVYEFPKLQKQMAIAVLFIPSVVFWGSGLLKDAVTFACVGLFASSLHQIIKMRKNVFRNILYIVLSSILLIKIKAYIFFALMPGSLLWISGVAISGVNNQLIKSSLTPILIVLTVLSGYAMLHILGGQLGDFRMDNLLAKAAVSQQDLKQDYYGGSSFDIGEFDPTPSGVLKKAPAAIMAALFRPYIFEARNPGMIVSGIENLILLLLTIYLILKLRVYNLFRLLFRHHFLFFSVFFSLFFAFSIGLSTSNFGSMVRYKIPAIPFFVASLFIISGTYKDMKKENELLKARRL